MSSAGYAPDRASAPFTARTVLDAWRGIGWSEVRAALLLGSAAFAYHFVVFAVRWTQKPSPILPLIQGFALDQISAFSLMLAVVVADRVAERDTGRRAAYAVAVIASAASTGLLVALGESWFSHGVSIWVPPAEFSQAVLYSFFEWLVLGGAATFVYTDRRRAHASLARRRAAEIERTRTAKRALESRLAAMQARVEPQFLFNTLAQVRDLYRADAALGERMLDELIAYLRAAMPRMRDTSSTVGQEIDLLRAYLAIVRLRLAGRFAFEIDLPQELVNARMPPMMLLPLADHVITHGFARSELRSRIRLAVAAVGDRLRLAIDRVGFEPDAGDERIAGIRERLAALYGDDASLTLRTQEAGTTHAVLEIPYERSEPREQGANAMAA